MKNVAIIGAGFVGASIAYALTINSDDRRVTLIDTNTEKAHGEALDINHGLSQLGNSFAAAGDYSDTKNSDALIICAGKGRTAGQSRLDLVRENILIMNSVTDSLKPYYNGCPVIIISNPNDIMTLHAQRRLGAKRGKVFGSGCILDTSRLIRCCAQYTGAGTGEISGYVIGEHGDGQVTVWSSVKVCKKAIGEYCRSSGLEWNEEVRRKLSAQVRTMGADIIKRKGKTQYGIATCTLALTRAILGEGDITAPVTTGVYGQYGLSDVSVSLPCVIGRGGVSKILEIPLTDDELAALKLSADGLKGVYKTV